MPIIEQDGDGKQVGLVQEQLNSALLKGLNRDKFYWDPWVNLNVPPTRRQLLQQRLENGLAWGAGILGGIWGPTLTPQSPLLGMVMQDWEGFTL